MIIQDLQGHSVAFSSLKGPVTVVTFISTICPISNAYNDRMNRVYDDYGPKGVHFVFVNANSNESASAIAEHARSVGFHFPVYKDAHNRLSDLLGANVTPESFVIDQAQVVRYHGQLDDSRNEARVHQKSLRVALDQLLSNSPVTVAETKAFGCTIKKQRVP